MIEELKNTDIVNKVGGRFKLSALIENTEGLTPMEIVVQEIKEDKIVLDATGNETKPKLDLL